MSYDIEPLSIAEVMRMTGRSRRTIDRWIKDGHLHAVDLGGFDGVIVDRGEAARCEKRMRDSQQASRQAGPETAT